MERNFRLAGGIKIADNVRSEFRMNLSNTGRRFHLSKRDLDFLLRVLARDEREGTALLVLLTDAGTVDRVLDSPALFDRILRSQGALEISDFLYFYLMVRGVFRESGLRDPDLADYVAGALVDCSLCPSTQPDSRSPLPFLVDWNEELEQAVTSYEKFFLSVQIGNFLLVATGIFHEHLKERSRRRGAPGLRYYEDFGAGIYKEASRHPLAREFFLEDRFFQLSESFRSSRRALNRLSDQFLCWN